MLEALLGDAEGPSAFPTTSSAAARRSSRTPAAWRWRASFRSGCRRHTGRADARVAEIEVRRTAGVRHRRLHQADNQGARHRRAAARLLRRRQAHLRRPRRHRFQRADFARTARAARWHPRRTIALRGVPAEAKRDAIWVEPRLVCEVEYRSWTHDGRLRHASFRACARTDRRSR